MTEQIYRIILNADVYVEETTEADPNNEWSRASTSTSWDFHDIVEVVKEEDYKISFDGILTYSINFEPQEKLWLVIPIWSTGDSFGYDTCARAEIFGAYASKEEAEQRKNDLLKGIVGPREYLPWSGYFESLEYITIEEVDVVKK